MKNLEMENTILEIIDKLEEFDDWQNFTRYRITEYFKITGFREYEAYNIKMELDNICGEKTIVFYDINCEIIKDLSRVLNVFLLKTLTDIITKDKYIKLQFEDGYIEIRY